MFGALKGAIASFIVHPLPLVEAQAALLNSIKSNDISTMEAIIKRNSKDKQLVNSASKEEGDGGNTFLQLATLKSNEEAVRILLQYGANPMHMNAAGDSAVHVATAQGKEAILNLFLATENGVTACFSVGNAKNTPLHYAVIHERLSCLSALLDCMNKNTTTTAIASVHFKNENNYTPLTLAIHNGANEFSTELLKYPSLAKLHGSHDGEPPIHMVVKKGDLNILIVLRNTSPHVTDTKGRSALHYAVQLQHEEIVRELLAQNVYVLVRDIDGNTPLHLCTNEVIAKLLADHLPQLPNMMFHIVNKKGEIPFQNDPNLAGLIPRESLQPITPSFNVQLCSDLHTEFPHTIEITPKAPYLALLGDIGLCVQPKYRAFLLDCANKFEKVFVILGNHEFYRFNVESTIKTAEDICNSHPNLIFMNRKSIFMNGVRILGCTLWSHIRETDMLEVNNAMSDYRVIKIEGEPLVAPPAEPDDAWKKLLSSKGRPLTTEDTLAWHKSEVEWLKKEIETAKIKNEKVVVFTHHCPVLTGDAISDETASLIRSACSTDLTDMFGDPLVAWCYGHTHWYNDVTVKGTRILSNPHGYPHGVGKDKIEKSFDPYFVLSV